MSGEQRGETIEDDPQANFAKWFKPHNWSRHELGGLRKRRYQASRDTENLDLKRARVSRVWKPILRASRSPSVKIDPASDAEAPICETVEPSSQSSKDVSPRPASERIGFFGSHQPLQYWRDGDIAEMSEADADGEEVDDEGDRWPQLTTNAIQDLNSAADLNRKHAEVDPSRSSQSQFSLFATSLPSTELATNYHAPAQSVCNNVPPENASVCCVDRRAMLGNTLAFVPQLPGCLPPSPDADSASHISSRLGFGEPRTGSRGGFSPNDHQPYHQAGIPQAGPAIGYHRYQQQYCPTTTSSGSPTTFCTRPPIAASGAAPSAPPPISGLPPTLSGGSVFTHGTNQRSFCSVDNTYTQATEANPIHPGSTVAAPNSAGFSLGFGPPLDANADPFNHYPFAISAEGPLVDRGAQFHPPPLDFHSYPQLSNQMRLYDPGSPPSTNSRRDGAFSPAQGPSRPTLSSNQRQERQQRSGTNHPGLNDSSTVQPSTPLNNAFVVIEHGPVGVVAIDESDTDSGNDANDGPHTVHDAVDVAKEVDAEAEIDVDNENDTNAGSSNAVHVRRRQETQRKPRRQFYAGERRETAETRKLIACVRCQIQKCRCQVGPGGPDDQCRKCSEVDTKSKKFTHNLPCLRYRIGEIKLSRLGAGEHGSLNLTRRWPAFQVQDIDSRDWASDVTRLIKITLNKCGAPSAIEMDIEVRKFTPRHGDVLHRSWRVGNKLNRKMLEPYAIANIQDYAQGFKKYVHDNAIKAMVSYSVFMNKDDMYKDFGTEDPLAAETYKFAVRHYNQLLDGKSEEDQSKECQFMGSIIRLWFSIRHTVGSSSICSDDRLDMAPEEDANYPLGTKISTPRMIIEQIDCVNAAVIAKLSKSVLRDLEDYLKNARPAQWFTLYLAVFILLHEVDVATEDRRRHGRANNDDPNKWYSLPVVVHELQKGANVLLHFWLYYRNNEDPSPMTAAEWRASPRLSGLTSVQFDFVRRSAAELKRKRAEFESRDDDMWEGQLYWVSQMFDKDWTPGRIYPAH